MPELRPPFSKEAALKALDIQVAADPKNSNLHLARALTLEMMGRFEDAKQTYLQILTENPAHLNALKRFGQLLYTTGYRSAAMTVYREILKLDPDDPDSRVKMGTALFIQGDYAQAKIHFEAALRLAPNHAAAHQGYGNLLMELREEGEAWTHLRLGYRQRPFTTLPYRGTGTPCPLLVLSSSTGGNIPLLHLLDNRIYQISLLAAEFYDPSVPLPPHRLIFNAIGDADLCPKALGAAASLLIHSQAPLINPPQAVAATCRSDNALRLGRIPGVVTPKTITLSREDLSSSHHEQTLASHGLGFPLLLRAQGFHAGKHFMKIDGVDGLALALEALPGKDFTAIEFLNASNSDGKTRKYRVMFIGRKAYPLHAAVSHQWKIHYFSAEMKDHPDHRAEDQAFLEDMPKILGVKAMEALDHIMEVLGLDYAGADFSLNAAGEILLFEANATMVVHAPDPDPCWDYRRAPVSKILDAIKALLAKKIADAS